MNLNPIFKESKNLGFPRITKDLSTEIVIIGGGMTGLMSAHLLTEAGFKIILLEAQEIGESNSSKSSGNLFYPLYNTLSELMSLYTQEEISEILLSRKEALKRIIKTIEKFKLNCDFNLVPWVRYSSQSGQNIVIENEYLLANTFGENIELINNRSDEFHKLNLQLGLKITEQIQINPYKFLTNLAKNLNGKNCQIFTHSRVSQIEKAKDETIVWVNGKKIRTKYLIEATNSPLGDLSIHDYLLPYKICGIAGVSQELKFSDGIYWDHFSDKEVYYLRKSKESILVLSRSEDFEKLENYIKTKFPNIQMTHKWNSQHYDSVDLLPLVGKLQNENIFIATGFSSNGLVFGALASMLIRNEILGIKKSYAALFSVNRKSLSKSNKKVIGEKLNKTKNYLLNYLSIERPHKLKSKEGVVIGVLGDKIALYKDEKNIFHAFSALCPHHGCFVKWNTLNKSWDCSCHGSRFDCEGHVIEGPSLKDLTPVSIKLKD